MAQTIKLEGGVIYVQGGKVQDGRRRVVMDAQDWEFMQAVNLPMGQARVIMTAQQARRLSVVLLQLAEKVERSNK